MAWGLRAAAGGPNTVSQPETTMKIPLVYMFFGIQLLPTTRAMNRAWRFLDGASSKLGAQDYHPTGVPSTSSRLEGV